jgi:protein TonB
MDPKRTGILIWLLQRVGALAIAAALTLALFMILPVMQAIGRPDRDDLSLRNMDLTSLPPPPPDPEPEIEEEEPPPEKPPELQEEAPPLDLSQLELALNPTVGAGAFGDFAVKLIGQFESGGGSEEMDKIFSLTDLDQQPRALFQRQPRYPPEMKRRNRQGTVYIVFMVDKRGRVVNPKVERSTDPGFDVAALEAVKQWKFEPGTRNGEKVPFKMRVPITFNASG